MNNPYIGFWKRAVAFVIDVILASIPPALICGPLLLRLANNADINASPETSIVAIAGMAAVYMLWNLLSIVSFWLYFALLESGPKQATLGKRLLGIKVVDYQGNRLTFARATGRLFAKFLSYATIYIGFIMAGTSCRKRALHDYIAQTYVVRKAFQPGDGLPDTQSHPVWLGIITAGIFLILGMSLLTLVGSSTAIKAQTAALRLQQLAQEKHPLSEPLTLDGITYTHSRAGYRARFEDWEAETYTLLLDPKTGTVCCEDFPGENCSAAAIDPCH